MRVFHPGGLKQAATLAALSLAVSLLPGCSLLSDEKEQKITVGTTSAPSTLDPAASWDGSWELFRNIYQTLLSYPSGATAPEPDAAESCRFTDLSRQVYACKLRKGLEFSDGEPLNASAVKRSIDRIRTVNKDGGGPSGLLGSLSRVETEGERNVTFRLNKPDATFPFVLATPALSIVPAQKYPTGKERDDGSATGSGPYVLKSYDEETRAVLVKNDKYKGYATIKNDAVTIRYFKDSAKMIEALKKKQIDLTFRGLAAKDTVDLQTRGTYQGIQLVEGAGTEVRYLAFNPKHRWAGRREVRSAIAQVLDRGGITHKIHHDTVESLYSMVPRGLVGHTTAYFDTYGNPDAKKARAILTKAGITEPVPLKLWYAQDRFGSTTKLEFEEIKRQLNATGLFAVDVVGLPSKKIDEGFRKGEYTAIGDSWYPDFPDADNFIAPFVGEQNAIGIPYKSPEITDKLLPESRQESDRSAVVGQFRRAQQILVEDARLLPLWQSKQYLATSEDIAGTERALDPSTIMLMWELYRKTSW